MKTLTGNFIYNGGMFSLGDDINMHAHMDADIVINDHDTPDGYITIEFQNKNNPTGKNGDANLYRHILNQEALEAFITALMDNLE